MTLMAAGMGGNCRAVAGSEQGVALLGSVGFVGFVGSGAAALRGSSCDPAVISISE